MAEAAKTKRGRELREDCTRTVARGSQTEPFRRGRGADVKMSRVQEEVRSWKKEGKPSIN